MELRSWGRRGKTSNDGIYVGFVERRTDLSYLLVKRWQEWGRMGSGAEEGGGDRKLSCSLSQGTASDKMEGSLVQIASDFPEDCSQLSSPLTWANREKKRHEIGSNWRNWRRNCHVDSNLDYSTYLSCSDDHNRYSSLQFGGFLMMLCASLSRGLLETWVSATVD